MLILAGDFATVAGILRAGLARINANVASELDVQWTPPFDRATMGIPVALAFDATNVFVATPGGIQKYQIPAPGSPDPAWASPEVFSGISSLAIVDEKSLCRRPVQGCRFSHRAGGRARQSYSGKTGQGERRNQ